MRIVMLEPIGISDKELNSYKKELESKGHDFIFYDNRVEKDDILIERIGEAEIIILTNLPLSARVLNSCSDLKLISVAFTGVDHIDKEACQKNGITVCNSSGYADEAVAELVFGLSISLMRNVIPCDQVVRKGKTRAGLIGNELAGKKLGIIGTGSIGSRVAEIGSVLGCELFGNDLEEKEELQELGLTYLELDELMSSCDIISLHVPLLESTKGMIDQEKINLMKKDAILINTARGPVVDSEALAAALQKGVIAGAGIDVFEMEPPIPEDHPLLNAPHTVVTPHVAFATEEAFSKRADIVFDNVFSWLEGKTKNKMF
ncbi:MAG: 2-hydroxyacid dehydrogenase [Bacillota bacterium]